MFKIMLLFFFRLMAIDMTLFQFIDWFLEQMDQEEIEEIKEEISKNQTSSHISYHIHNR